MCVLWDFIPVLLTLAFSKAIFLAGSIIWYLALVNPITRIDPHGLSGTTFRLGIAAVFLCIQVAFLSLANTILFVMLSSGFGGHISTKILRVLYYSEVSLLFCLLLIGAANWWTGISFFFFFKQFDSHMLYVGLGMLCFMGLGCSPVIVLVIGLYFTIRPNFG